MEQRKRRRKKCSRRKPLEDLCESVNSEKRSSDMEQLAHKYTKCRVESSTDSESDANVEFLDPYDGDYEEVPGSSDCSLDSLADVCPRREILPKYFIPESLTMESFPPEHQEFLSASPYWAVSSAATGENGWMKPADNLMLMETAVEDNGKGSHSGLCREAELYKTVQVLQPTTEPSWFIDDPSKHCPFSDNVVPASILWPIVKLNDQRVCEDPIIKRKQGQPLLECTGEKLRKKLRAT